MIIKTAEYVISNSDVRQCPDGNLPEYAFIGRSNVGKSSLINMLTGRKGLAKTSSMPGETLLLDHFLINGSWYIVDLPGYGYAKRGKDMRDKLRRMIEGYVGQREQMTYLFVLIDSRHAPQKIDLEFMQWRGENGVPFSIVFTKMDKIGKVVGMKNVEAYKKILQQSWEELPPVFLTSSEDRRGREELLDYIDSVNKSLKNQ